MKSAFLRVVFSVCLVLFLIGYATKCDAYVLHTDLGVKLVLLDKIELDSDAEAEISSKPDTSKSLQGAGSPSLSLDSKTIKRTNQAPTNHLIE